MYILHIPVYGYGTQSFSELYIFIRKRLQKHKYEKKDYEQVKLYKTFLNNFSSIILFLTEQNFFRVLLNAFLIIFADWGLSFGHFLWINISFSPTLRS